MADRRGLVRLSTALAGLYDERSDARALAERAGLRTANIDISGPPRTYVWNVVREAERSHALSALIDAALEDYPRDDNLLAARRDDFEAVTMPVEQPDVADEDWRPALGVLQAEKLMGDRSTFLPVSYLQTGVVRARAVARVVLEGASTGTGFLVADDVLVTNHHVISTVEQARTALVQFNFQEDADGRPAPIDERTLDPHQGFYTSPMDGGHDLTAVRLATAAGSDWGTLPMGTRQVAVGDRVTIIQHPEGSFKKIALHRNIVTYVDDDVVQYLTDTLPGSSGSPVFDSSWALVGVHHAGGSIVEPKSGRTVFRNEGIAAGWVRRAITELG